MGRARCRTRQDLRASRLAAGKIEQLEQDNCQSLSVILWSIAEQTQSPTKRENGANQPRTDCDTEVFD